MNILKNIKLKSLLVLLFILFMFPINSIYAVDLKYEANIDANKDAIIRTYAKAYAKNPMYWLSDVKNIWVYDNINGYTGGKDYYRQCGYLFYGNYKLANYNNSNIGNGYWARYDTYDGKHITADKEDPGSIIEDFGSKEVYVTSNTNQPMFSISSNGTKNNKVYIERKTQIKTDNFYVLVDDIVIKDEFVKELNKKLNKPENIDGDYLKIGMSITNHASAPTATSQLDQIMDNGYEAVKEMSERWWDRSNLGYAQGWDDTVKIRQGMTTGTSILNHYDNWLLIPLGKVNSRTVELRYVVKGDDGEWKTVKKEYKYFNKDAQTIDIGTITKANLEEKGVTIASGVDDINNYYIGGKMSMGSTKKEASDAFSNSTNKWGYNTKNIKIEKSEDEEYYIVKLYYGPREIEEKHVDLEGNLLEEAKMHILKTSEKLTLSAKQFSDDNYSYLYQYVDKYTTISKKTTITVEAWKNAENTFKTSWLDPKTVTFYYKKTKKRVVEINYLVKDKDGKWQIAKTQTQEVDNEKNTISKENLSENDLKKISLLPGVDNINDYYIGGKYAKGTSLDNAESKLDKPDKSWGYDTSKITIPASASEEYYMVYLYYGPRIVEEKHVDMKGNLLTDVKTHVSTVKEKVVLKEKSNDFIDGNYKFVYQKANLNGVDNTLKTITIPKPTNAKTALNLNNLDTQKVTFYYKKIGERILKIKYLLKDEDGKWQEVKTEEKKFFEEAQEFEKASIGDKDYLYIGGKLSEGSTLEEAEKKISDTKESWGWDDTTINIEASEDAIYYVVELYYDYRDISEYHLKTNGDVINPKWNKTPKDFGWLSTKDDVILKAKKGDVYYKGAKYVHVSTEVNGDKYTAKEAPEVKIRALKGNDILKFADSHYVKFYYEYEPTREIYVRHFVYNDSTEQYERVNVLTNSNSAIKDGTENKYHLRNNGYNQRKYKEGNKKITDNIKNGFNEQYTIDFGDTIKLDKSRTIENEGIQYNYKGVKVQNDTVPSILTTKAQADTLDSTATVVLNPDNVKKTYIDFYYTKTDIIAPGASDIKPDGGPENDPGDDENVPENDAPTIDFVPKDDSGNDLGPDSADEAGDCKVVYVPAGENLKAYMTASTYRPYSLIYNGESVNVTTGEVSYKLEKYDAYKFVDGTIENNSESKYGYINSTEKYGVFNANSNTAVNPISSVINDVLKNSVAEFENLNPNTLTKVLDGRKTTQADFGNDNIHKVNTDKYNGIRKPAGTAYYNVTALVKNGNDVFEEKKAKTAVETANNSQVNIFTPAAIKDVVVESEEIVNHSNQETFVIQKNSEFRVTPISNKATDYKNINDTSKYIKYYWFVADFDVKLLETQMIYNKEINQITTAGSGQIVKAGNLIQILKGSTFRAVATNDDISGDIVNQFSNKLKVIAVTYNVTDEEFEKKIASSIRVSTNSAYVDKNKIAKVVTGCDKESIKQSHSSIVDININIYANDMYDDAHYFVEQSKTSKNIGRIYDFKVTDCLDVNFKNVFRKSDNGNVNDLRGIKYFSGVRRLLVYGGNGIQIGGNQSNTNNIFDERAKTDDTINSVASKTILPLGPYSHIDANYIQAPKLGYRISYDLKTSGVYTKNGETNREIKITPSYYYISKDGKTYKDNISLYYKNSSGKYISFEGSGYTIYFKPNDGYRTVYNTEAPELSDMSVKLESLRIGDESFILTDSMMSYSDNNFVQAWYGEFKLPNSTIAIEKGGNINNPLTDGYIGVKFKIQCIDKERNSTEETIVSYDQDDKSASPSINTSQWDYEGYLGFAKSNIGKELEGELRIQLEKDVWRINKEMYKKIKGTVVLYDTDNRAAEDFD